jgi:hypothetical protein
MLYSSHHFVFVLTTAVSTDVIITTCTTFSISVRPGIQFYYWNRLSLNTGNTDIPRDVSGSPPQVFSGDQ